MSRNSVYKNSTLNKAFLCRKDEFYTQYEDIVKEMQYYKDDFHDKVILCNCDNPYESAFFKFFTLHFNQLKISKLICTGYNGSVNNKNGYKAIMTKTNDSLEEINKNTLHTLFSMNGNSIEHLDDADFRSNDCVNLLKEADIVVTNPPFSLFREF